MKLKRFSKKTIQETTCKTTQEKNLELLKENPKITINELAKQTGLSSEGVKYHLNKLKKKNIIKHIGSRKKGYWEILNNLNN